MKHRLLLSLATLMIFAGLGRTAFADSLTIAYTNPSQAARPGQTLSFTATLTAPTTNNNAFFINGDSFSAGFPITVDDSPFFNIPYPFSLSPGQSYTTALFNVLIAANAPVGTFVNTFKITGGSDQNDNSVVVGADFTTTVTPEPSTWLLMTTGLLGLVVITRRTPFQEAIRSTLS